MSTTDTRPDPQHHDQQMRGLSARGLVAMAERYDATADQHGLDAARAEAERRADDQPADSLAAQVAGYLGLLAEDSEHALADEAHDWSRALRRALEVVTPPVPPVTRVPAPRAGDDVRATGAHTSDHGDGA